MNEVGVTDVWHSLVRMRWLCAIPALCCPVIGAPAVIAFVLAGLAAFVILAPRLQRRPQRTRH